MGCYIKEVSQEVLVSDLEEQRVCSFCKWQ